MSLYWTIDLGATSGRVMSARLESDRIVLDEQGRFPNIPVERRDGLFWDVGGLWEQTVDALANAAERARESSIWPAAVAVDAWGVDFALVDGDGEVASGVRHYRSTSAAGGARVREHLSARELFHRTGVAHMDINTVYRLADGLAELGPVRSDITMLLIGDYWTFRLSGQRAAELTLAGTTSLLGAVSKKWDADLLAMAGIDPRVLPPIAATGTSAGTLLPTVAERIGCPADVLVVRTASHDTAAAIAAIPGRARVAFISCGTWALVGVETDRPVLSDQAFALGFTNEIGATGQTLFMRNLTGLWLLEQVLTAWRVGDPSLSLASLLCEAEALEGLSSVVDVGSESLARSSDVASDIRRICRQTGQPVPLSAPEMVRCILHSLADGFGKTLRECERLAGAIIDEVHMVGGGTRNVVLCQLVADACERPLLVGPAEASSLGNALVQARARGEVESQDHMREIVRNSFPTLRYLPRRPRHSRRAAPASFPRPTP